MCSRSAVSCLGVNIIITTPQWEEKTLLTFVSIHFVVVVFVVSNVLTEAFVTILVGARAAPLGAHSVLQHVAVHAQQAVGTQRAFTGVTAPVALCKQIERQQSDAERKV